MSNVKFELVSLPGDRYIINDRGRTVALISFEGAIDWLLKSPQDSGPLITKIAKDCHLAYTQGLRLCFVPPSVGGDGQQMKTFKYRLEDGSSRLVMSVDSRNGDGSLTGRVEATLCTDEKATRYEWHMHAQITNTSGKDMTPASLEFENIYPGQAGLCFLCEQTKEYRWTLMVDRDGVIWRCPHQHVMHYSHHVEKMHFAQGSWAGFFGQPGGSPVVIVDKCEEEPFWGICQMYYDLHSCCRMSGPFKAGTTINYVHRVLYMSDAESDKLVAVSKPVPVTAEDHEKNDHPRLAIGMNSFDRCANIEGEDQASAFRAKGTIRVWDRETGCSKKGSLRITNDKPCETAWGGEPPTVVPGNAKLIVRGKMKTSGVVGKGAYVRLIPYYWEWEPTPHCENLPQLCSVPVNGTTDGWVSIEVPALTTTKQQCDTCLWVQFVLDGQGVAWLTDLDVDLKT